jgi:putative ABC transport system ATP-binding protein
MIRLVGVHKRFFPGDNSEVYALRGIDLQVAEGDFVTLIGTNGSGKSTLLNAIAGSFFPDRGTITVAGDDVTKRPDYWRARYIARVFQNPFSGTAPDLTVAENLRLAELRGKPRHPWGGLGRSSRARYGDEVKRLEMQLEDRLDATIGTLSGGQRQALTLLMAVMADPKVLLLDEHTAALDPKSAAQVAKLTVAFVRERKLTAVMVTHSMEQALELGNRTVMMVLGSIVEDLVEQERRRLTPDDLVEKFADLRKVERLTPELREVLRAEYR